MERVKTGIEGFDDLIGGGLNKNSAVLLTGIPGVGKTIFGIQFIYAGAKLREPGLFISCEETAESITEYTKEMGFDFSKYNDLITVLYQPLTGKVMTFGNIIDIIKQKKIKRLVLDSLTLFGFMNNDENSFRKSIADFINQMKTNGVTMIATTERDTSSLAHLRFKPEDFLFEGLVLLTKIRKGSSYERCVSIEKLRQNHQLGFFPFTIDEKGITVFPKQLPFSLIERDSHEG